MVFFGKVNYSLVKMHMLNENLILIKFDMSLGDYYDLQFKSS